MILVAGATGYVGGHLIPRLLKEGYRIRVLARDIEKVKAAPWGSDVEVCKGDVFKPLTLAPALSGVDVAYYLIHSITRGSDFAERDIHAGQNFGEAAKTAGVERVIYLGGLGDPDSALSEHLKSRQDTGDALRRSGVCVTEFRAAIIVGSGSVSFEMIRYLTERVPIMICPRWVRTRVQPIGIDDVVEYLVASLRVAQSAGQVIEIGGTDVLTYGEMMKDYACVRGLHRRLLHVPVLTPLLSSYWVHWVTPVPAAFARPLIEGLRSEVIVRDNKASGLFPQIKPVDYNSAVRRALSQLHPDAFQNFVSQSAPVDIGEHPTTFKTIHNGMIVEIKQCLVRSRAASVYRSFTELGGPNNWPCHWAWRIRAFIDRILGGVGMRKGRPDPNAIRVGDTLDYFRVVEIRPDRMIRLKVDMKLPGEGWVQFEAIPAEERRTRLRQTVFFAPKGLIGLLYWYLLYPFHVVIFGKMIKEIAGRAEQIDTGGVDE
ncbi:MAG: SDR family oxidoreductase [Sedimentisphaerales bacterium]|nr:SDR family oxidoreductase [Sedimentisphaerales bacterium]